MSSDPSFERRVYYLTFVCLFLLQLCPIWFTSYPAMHDYPNHLARAVIVHELSGNESYQVTYEYEPRWWLIPNLTSDLVLPAMLKIASVETASRLFLSLIVLVFNVGAHVLGRAIDHRPHWMALVSTFFFYSFFWSMGLPNYLIGLGLFLITLGSWLQYRQAWTAGRVFTIALLALACYATHLSAFVFFGVSVVCWEGLESIKMRTIRREQVVGILPLVVPTLAYLLYSSGIEAKAPMEWWQPILIKKAMGLVYPFLSYDLFLDAALGVAFVVLLGLALCQRGWSFANRDLFLVGIVLVALYIIAPMGGGVQSTYVDRRIIVPAAMLLLLAIRIDVAKRAGGYLLIALLGLCVVRVGEVWYHWNRIGEEVRGQVQMLERLPEEAKLYPMFVNDQSTTGTWLWDMHFYHTAHYATIYRHAFVPTLYAARNAFIIRLRTGNTGYAQIERDTPLEEVKWDVIKSRYEYLLGYKLSTPFKDYLRSNGEVLAERGPTLLIRLRKETAATASEDF